MRLKFPEGYKRIEDFPEEFQESLKNVAEFEKDPVEYERCTHADLFKFKQFAVCHTCGSIYVNPAYFEEERMIKYEYCI